MARAESTAETGAGTAPPGRPRARARFDDRQGEIVDAAARAFAEHGYHATSIDDLVAATGLQRGGLYHYIGGKQELLVRIHERFIDPLLEEARTIAAADEPPDVAIRSLAHALMRGIATYRDHFRAFLSEWRMIERDPRWQDVRHSRREFEDIVTAVLVRGREQGLFRVPDERLATLGLLGMLVYTYQWFDPAGRLSDAEVADSFCDIFLGGIQTEPR